MKNWKTTLAGIIGVVLMALGLFIPEKFDPETQAEMQNYLNEIIGGIGGLITLITALVAKDPDVE